MKAIKSIKQKTKFLQWILYNTVVAVVIPVSIELLSSELSTVEEITIGFGIFVVISFAEILYYVQELQRRDRIDHSVWQARNKFERILKELRENFATVLQARHSENDNLFEDLILQDVTKLNEEVKDAAYNKVVWVKDHHFKSHDKLEKIFKDTDTNVYRELYILEKSKGSFDYIYTNFFKMIAKMVKKKELEVRTLFVRPQANDCIDTRFIQNLLNYYDYTQGFNKKLIDEYQLKHLMPEYKVGDSWTDFGIYGDHLIFKTQEYIPNGPTTGLFSQDKDEVMRFLAFFDKAWEDAQDILPQSPRQIALDRIFETSA